MSESRSYSYDSSESRGYDWGRESYTSSSESRDFGESRGYSPSPTSSSESRSDIKPKSTKKVIGYNDLESIDKLISKLEVSISEYEGNDCITNTMLDKRKKQMQELKTLRESAQKAIEDSKKTAQFVQESEEIDDCIKALSSFIKNEKESQKTRKRKNNNISSESR